MSPNRKSKNRELRRIFIHLWGYIVKNNPGTLSNFVGGNPQALAELYYSHEPSQDELEDFLQKYFAKILALNTENA